MKVLHLSSEASWRGGEQQMAYLLHGLKIAGIESHLLCRPHSAFQRYCQLHHFPYQTLPFKNSLDWRSAMKLRAYQINNRFDLIHLHSSKSHGIAVLAAALGLKGSLILSRRVDFELKDNFLSRWKYNHPQIRKVICVSKAIEQMVKAKVKNPDIVTTIHSGIDLGKFSQEPTGYLRRTYHISSHTKLVGNTSALADQKDYFTFIDVAEELSKSKNDIHFFLIGSGPLEKELRDYISKKQLNHRITMTGFLDNIEEVLPELDVFLMTSKTEGLGTSILDAFAAHVPVVSTNAGGLGEMVKDEQTGLIADIGDVQKLSTHTLRLLNEPILRQELVSQAHAFVQQFDQRKMVQQTLATYHEVLSA